MEPSLWPLRYAWARQHTFISVYTLRTHGQLIYLTYLQITVVGDGGGVQAGTHVGFVCLDVGSTWYRLHVAKGLLQEAATWQPNGSAVSPRQLPPPFSPPWLTTATLLDISHQA